MHKILFWAAAGALLSVFADVYRTNTVDGLLYLLNTYNGQNANNVIELEPGDYFLPEVATYTNNSSGLSSIYAEKIRVRGLGTTNAATRLISSGTCRVAYGVSNATFENLTFTNGHASAFTGAGNANRGGGVYGGCTLTNCLVIGNTADGVGGGVQSSTKLYNCQVINNTASNGGGGHNFKAYGTRFEGNSAGSNGGAVYTAELYDCELVGNIARNGDGGGGYNITYATNTLIANNAAIGGNGGGAGNSASSQNPAGYVLVDCVVSNNSATKYGGGISTLSATNCLIVNNFSASGGGGAASCHLHGSIIRGNIASGHGGGILLSGIRDDFPSLIVSNCLIEANVCSNFSSHAYGGGVCYSSATALRHVLTHCEIRGNAALKVAGSEKTALGGGVGVVVSQYPNVTDCEIHDNYATADGGGIRGVTAVRCRLYRNASGSNGAGGHYCSLIDCDIAHSSTDYCTALRTDFHDFGTAFSLEGNPYMSGSFSYGMITGYFPNYTNSLFRNNHAPGILFRGTVASGTPSSLVNCTVVSNSAQSMFAYFAKADYPLTLENCVFFDNATQDGTPCDISFAITGSDKCTSNSVHISHCAYGTDNVSAKQNFSDWFREGQYVFGAEGFPASPYFSLAKDAEHPYSLRTSSPLIGCGKVEPWMMDATDIRGEGFPRLRDGTVDIGCYQCWLDPVGTVFIIR